MLNLQPSAAIQWWRFFLLCNCSGLSNLTLLLVHGILIQTTLIYTMVGAGTLSTRPPFLCTVIHLYLSHPILLPFYDSYYDGTLAQAPFSCAVVPPYLSHLMVLPITNSYCNNTDLL